MAYDCEKLAAQEIIKGIAKQWVDDGFKEEKLHRLEEKVIFSQSLISRITKEKCEDADKSLYRITNYSQKSKRELLMDINALLTYMEDGNTLSGYLFSLRKMVAPKLLKKRLYVIDEVYVDGKSCDTIDSLSLVQNVLKVDLTLNDLTNIWGTHQQEFASYDQQFHFFTYLMLEAIDCVQGYNLASLSLENVKWGLQRNSF